MTCNTYKGFGPRDFLTPADEVSASMNCLILIPARMASTRLPNKPLADIGGLPMIVRVAQQAHLSGIGRVVVATDAPEVKQSVEKHGFDAVMTRADHQSGSDRIWEALTLIDRAREVDIVVNVQGDLPTIDPAVIQSAILPLENPVTDIATLAAEIVREDEKTNENVVKVAGSPIAPNRLRALYFTRATVPWGQGPLYHHIGLYAYRRAALQRFVGLGPSSLERRERLEQLRALEAGMRIDVEIVKTAPLGVDTPHDLQRARALVAGIKE